MKKFVFFLFACLACLQSHEAVGAVSNFAESIRNIEAILEATADPEFSDLFKANEYIIDITRKTKIDLTGKAKYLLTTCLLNEAENCRKIKKYIATIRVEPKPGIGPNIITVLNIKKVNSFR